MIRNATSAADGHERASGDGGVVFLRLLFSHGKRVQFRVANTAASPLQRIRRSHRFSFAGRIY